MDETREALINRQMGVGFLSLPQHISWNEDLVLTGVSLRWSGEGWLAVVKASNTRKHVVAFVGADDYAEAIGLVAEMAEKGQLTWRPDKYPPNKLQR